jgi:Ni/Co efflux regulator RcnB
MQLGAPPAGHRYVRVGGDILLVTTGQAIVVDALQYLASR